MSPEVTSEICNICGKKKVRGSITQWIFSGDNCSCSAPEKQGILQLCPLCGCRQRSTSGSITQWIFAPVQCKCEAKHAPIDEQQLPPDDIIPGGIYEFIGVAGIGGIGTVYKARNKKLAKTVAIKAITPALNEIFDSQKFEREAKSISKLQHPNVLSILEFGAMTDGRPFLVTEWIEGCTLAQYITRHGVLSPKAAEEVFSAVCDGLSHAHKRHIVHRDIKPGNIMLSRSSDGWTVKVIDFGTSKDMVQDQSTTRIEDIAFSPYYVSPERISGIDVDERADLYSLGCTMFEALTGRPPFTGKAMTVALRHQTEAPPTLFDVSKGIEYPKKLEQVVAKLLAKDPQDRFQTAEQVKAALISREPRETKSGRSSLQPLLVYAATATVIVLVFGVLMYVAFLAPTDSFGNKSSGPIAAKNANASIESNTQIKAFVDTNWDGITWKAALESADASKVPDSPQFSHLHFRDKSLSLSDLSRICAHKNLRGLSLPACNLREEHLEILSNCDQLETLYIGENPALKDEHLLSLVSLPQLRTLSLSNGNFTDKVLETIAKMPSLTMLHLDALKNLKALGELNKRPTLTKLCLKHARLADEGWQQLGSLRYIQQLNLCDTELNDARMQAVAKMPAVDRLDITENQITKNSIETFKKMQSLKQLYIRDFKLGKSQLGMLGAHLGFKDETNSESLEDAVFRTDSQARSQTLPSNASRVNDNMFDAPDWLDVTWEGGRHWKIPGVTEIDDDEVERVARLPEYDYVSLISNDHSNFTERGLRAICRQPHLRGLAIAKTNLDRKKLEIVCSFAKDLRILTIGDNPALTDEDLECLPKLKQLRALDMTNGKFTDNCVDVLSKIDSLEHLKMGRMKNFTGAKLAKLGRLKKLMSLVLFSVPMSDQGWQQLSTLKQITVLNLDGTDLDDAKMQMLLNMPLERLSIRGTKITDKGFLSLAKLRGLKLLHAVDLANVSRKAIERLQVELPNCTIKKVILDDGHGDPLLAEPAAGREVP